MANKHIKRCIISLVVREMKTKTSVRYNFTTTRMAKIEKETGNN